MVFSSGDIQVGYRVRRRFAPPYEMAMQKMNDVLASAAERG